MDLNLLSLFLYFTIIDKTTLFIDFIYDVSASLGKETMPPLGDWMIRNEKIFIPGSIHRTCYPKFK